jgi:hypothetical protein
MPTMHPAYQPLKDSAEAITVALQDLGYTASLYVTPNIAVPDVIVMVDDGDIQWCFDASSDEVGRWTYNIVANPGPDGDEDDDRYGEILHMGTLNGADADTDPAEVTARALKVIQDGMPAEARAEAVRGGWLDA